MNGMKQIFQKEMARIFRDKKMVFSVFILPVAIMIGILTVTCVQKRMMSNIEGHIPVVYVENEPESFAKFREMAKIEAKPVKEGETEKIKEKILEGEADLLLAFPKEMDQSIQLSERTKFRRSYHTIIRGKIIPRKRLTELEVRC